MLIQPCSRLWNHLPLFAVLGLILCQVGCDGTGPFGTTTVFVNFNYVNSTAFAVDWTVDEAGLTTFTKTGAQPGSKQTDQQSTTDESGYISTVSGTVVVNGTKADLPNFLAKWGNTYTITVSVVGTNYHVAVHDDTLGRDLGSTDTPIPPTPPTITTIIEFVNVTGFPVTVSADGGAMGTLGPITTVTLDPTGGANDFAQQTYSNTDASGAAEGQPNGNWNVDGQNIPFPVYDLKNGSNATFTISGDGSVGNPFVITGSP